MDGPRVSYSVKLSHKEKSNYWLNKGQIPEKEFWLIGGRNEVDGYCWVERNFCH